MRILGRFITLALLAFSSAAAAQTQDHSLEDGSWALQFQVSGLVNLSDFQGGIISGKYHLADTRAIRFGVRLRASTLDRTDESFQESETTFPGGGVQGDTYESEREADGHEFSVGLRSQYLVYPAPVRQIKLYVGGGPMVDFGWSANEQVMIVAPPAEANFHRLDETESSARSWSFGAQGILGAEWFPARRISLTAEYGAGLVYTTTWGTREQRTTSTTETTEGDRIDVDVDVDESETSAWGLDALNATLGLTLYL